MQTTGTLALDSGGEIEYILDRGKRKNMYITIREGRVTLKIPEGLPIGEAERFMREKSGWILSKLSEIRESPIPESYSDGDSFTFLGGKLTVTAVKAPRYFEPRFSEDRLEIAVREDYDRQRFSAQAEAAVLDRGAEAIFERMRLMSAKTGLVPKKVTVKRLTGSWGRCSSEGNISINVNVVFYPPECLDYVLIHELCHLRHMDHSKDFWDLVARYCPDWKRIRAILK